MTANRQHNVTKLLSGVLVLTLRRLSVEPDLPHETEFDSKCREVPYWKLRIEKKQCGKAYDRAD